MTTGTAETRCGARLAELPADVLARILELVEDALDIARLGRACRAFRAPHGARGRSLVEAELRARAHRRGWRIPRWLAHGVGSWTDALLLHELRRRAGASCAASAGALVSAFVDRDGRLLACGGLARGAERHAHAMRLNAAAALGLGVVPAPGEDVLAPWPQPTVPPAAVRVVSVSAGPMHLLALAADGGVYSCGEGRAGALGHGDGERRYAPTRIGGLGGARAVSVSAGLQHSLILSAAGAVFSCGAGAHGELGHGDRLGGGAPRRVEALRGVRVRAVAAGDEHSLFLDEHGAVHACGSGRGGRLGLGDHGGRTAPCRLRAPSLCGVTVVGISAGGAHNLLVGAGGELFAFGFGASGELGLGADAPQMQPTPARVPLPEGARAALACAGNWHSLVVAEGGAVYAFGCGGRGQLGLGDLHPRLEPRRLELGTHTPVVCASASRCWESWSSVSLLTDARGRAYACGAGKGWRLGGGDEAERLTAERVREDSDGAPLRLLVH